jgi:hypothetical protein
MSRIHREDEIEETYCCPPEPKATQALKDMVRDYGGRGNPTPEPLSTQARAVLTAAEAWAAELDAGGRGTGWWQAWNPGTPILAIAEASRAYRASLQPGVRPEEVKPGTRFRFLIPTDLAGQEGMLVRIGRGADEIDHGSDAFAVGWSSDSHSHTVFRFADYACIIPLPKEQ